jgi:DNA invertase Pin-like site-specific DNA recombinase
MEGVLAAFARFDNDVRSERIRAGMRAALEQGRRTFVPPLGYLNAPKWSGKARFPTRTWRAGEAGIRRIRNVA